MTLVRGEYPVLLLFTNRITHRLCRACQILFTAGKTSLPFADALNINNSHPSHKSMTLGTMVYHGKSVQCGLISATTENSSKEIAVPTFGFLPG